MLKVQDFLLSFDSYISAIENLKEKYGISVKEYDDIVVLNYSQIDSPRFNKLSDDCRGLILSKDFKEIYSRSFTRFYNYGEGNRFDFNFSNSCIMEKLDGSLMMMWYHPKKKLWYVSSRKMAYGEGQTSYGGSTYRNLFMKCLNIDENISDEDFTIYINKKLNKYQNYTFIFEMTSPENRIVTPYSDYKVYLIGVRNNNPDIEKSYEDIAEFVKYFDNVYLPRMYNFGNIDEVQVSLRELGPLEEGYVCFDKESEIRVKVKSPAYVAIHYLRDNGLNLNKISVLVFENEYEEYLSYFPEDRHLFEPYIKAYESLKNVVSSLFNKYNVLEDQKEFALSVGKYPFSSILFEMRKGKSLIDVCSKFNDSKKLMYLNMFIDDRWKIMIKN